MILFLQGVFFYYIFTYKPVMYGDYEYPMWAEIMGLLISASSMICIPLYAVYYVLSGPGSIIENFKEGIIPEFEKKQRLTTVAMDTGRLFANGDNGDVTGSHMTKTPSEIPFLEVDETSLNIERRSDENESTT